MHNGVSHTPYVPLHRRPCLVISCYSSTMEITIQNRQRRSKLNLTNLQKMADILAPAVLENIKTLKPSWIASLATIPDSSCLSLIIVSPETIRKLNKQWLGKNKETDVLSFPLLDLSVLAKTKTRRRMADAPMSLEPQEPLELGEIFISYEQAQKQAKEYNHSLERELAFLFVHGLLHIFGFDHQEKADEKDMFSRQRAILNKTGYLR